MSFMIEVVVYLTVIIILPHEHDTDAQAARRVSKYIILVNTVGAIVGLNYHIYILLI